MMLRIFWSMSCLLLSLAVLGAPRAYGDEGARFLVLGVIASGDSDKGVALLKKVESGNTFAARAGETVASGITVEGVTRDFVYLRVQGRSEKIRVGEEFDPQTPRERDPEVNVGNLNTGIERRGNSVTISASLRDQLVKRQLGKVLVQAAAVPYYINGELVGFKLLEIDTGSIYDKVGLVNGDVVTHLNGQKMSDVAAAVRVLQSLKDETKVDIGFLRNGAEQTLQLAVQ